MKSYGLDLQHSDINSRSSEVISGTELPVHPVEGSIFYLTAVFGVFIPGQYLYDGVNWVQYGDITSVVAGYGLLGGGQAGEVNLAIDVSVVTTLINQVVAQNPNDPNAIDPIAMSLIFGS